ncbi:oxidoreductase [Paenibacillus sp. IB182496]|uniref:Oxidoreductase n=1 Tax=Paenibacillus sabuli TaxID=2772509 RepID=A0A927BWS9_9BACL|nr:oxidoreductase [Paenibacillus sabuli]MBD2846934.1 oxidoreductase [Paenibacillus sabuli]
MTIEVGVIGYGLSGSVFHAPLIAATDGLRLAAFVSSDPAKVHRDYPGASVYDSVDALVAREELDVIVVSSPSRTHYDYAKQALKAGKHVIVEKPFTATAAEAEELIALAQQRGLVLTVYQNRRWDGDFLTVRRLVDEGLLGRITRYEAHYDRFRPEPNPGIWKEQDEPGTGILYDLGSHIIDQALTLFGAPETVWADLGMEREGSRIVDRYHVVLGYASGLRAILQSGSLVLRQGPRYQVHGDGGSFVKSGLDPQEQQLKDGLQPGAPDWGRDRPQTYGELTRMTGGLTLHSKVETVVGSYERFYEGVVRAVTEGAPPPVAAADGLRTIQVIEAALRSHAEQRVVRLAD